MNTTDANMLAPLESEIRDVCQRMADFLVEKNRAYGNSAAEPVSVFAKRLDILAQIDVRIDDKLSRLSKGHEYPGDDTVKDLAGYLILRMVVKEIEDGKQEPQRETGLRQGVPGLPQQARAEEKASGTQRSSQESQLPQGSGCGPQETLEEGWLEQSGQCGVQKPVGEPGVAGW